MKGKAGLGVAATDIESLRMKLWLPTVLALVLAMPGPNNVVAPYSPSQLEPPSLSDASSSNDTAHHNDVFAAESMPTSVSSKRAAANISMCRLSSTNPP